MSRLLNDSGVWAAFSGQRHDLFLPAGASPDGSGVAGLLQVPSPLTLTLPLRNSPLHTYQGLGFRTDGSGVAGLLQVPPPRTPMLLLHDSPMHPYKGLGFRVDDSGVAGLLQVPPPHSLMLHRIPRCCIQCPCAVQARLHVLHITYPYVVSICCFQSHTAPCTCTLILHICFTSSYVLVLHTYVVRRIPIQHITYLEKLDMHGSANYYSKHSL